MAMDDPWGSPWADEIQHPVKIKGDDFSVKPTTPVKAASLALEQTTNSPWNDAEDDEFGQWAAVAGEEDNGFGFDGADSWESNTGDRHTLTRDDASALSISWKDDNVKSEETIPKLSPSLLPKPADCLLYTSPSPRD